ITQEEIDKMVLNVKSEFSKSGNLISLERLEKVLIDGYAMEDPLGLAGKEITVGISGVTSKSDVVKEFSGLASFLKLEFKGVFPIDFSVVEAKKHFSDLKDALFINIFENSASLFLLRSGFIDAIENADAGYGDFGRRLSENFSVGLEEAKNIKNKFISGDLDVNILDKARSLAFESAKVALGKIKPAISLLGRMDLLPKEIFISFFGDVPVQFSQAFKKSNNWFSDLPFSRDVEIAFLNASDFDNLLKDEKKLFTACEYAIIYHINKLK
ncbi:hypothetical protein HY249_02000, partial [Candidatus Azambacteria bacterium]|nr:hypothetical protein [Candidatus Azambacteria bacterium]